jgi:hypothetical protein
MVGVWPYSGIGSEPINKISEMVQSTWQEEATAITITEQKTFEQLQFPLVIAANPSISNKHKMLKWTTTNAKSLAEELKKHGLK